MFDFYSTSLQPEKNTNFLKQGKMFRKVGQDSNKKVNVYFFQFCHLELLPIVLHDIIQTLVRAGNVDSLWASHRRVKGLLSGVIRVTAESNSLITNRVTLWRVSLGRA